MGCPEHGFVVELAKRESRLLPDIRGTSLRVTRGSLWVTQQNDTRDHVLIAGDCWVADHDGLTIVEAQEDATVVLAEDAAGRRSAVARNGWARRWLSFLHRSAQAILVRPMRRRAPYY